jgi:hypothetical protein
VHCENLIVEIGAEKCILGPRELEAHQHRFNAAEQKEDECRDDEAPSDARMMDAFEPADETARLGPGLLKLKKLAILHFKLSR